MNEELEAMLSDDAPEASCEEAPEEHIEVDEIPEDTDGDYYGALVESDLRLLRDSFKELKGLESIGELANPMEFARLRDEGLSAVEAYLEISRPKRLADNRSHLRASMPAGRAKSNLSISRAELEMARELFPEESDAEIQKLYRSVTR